MLVDKMFDRELLLEYSWTGSSKKPNIKKSFSGLRQINRVFFNIVKSLDKNYNEYDQEMFFKTGVLKYASTRAKPKENPRQSTPRFNIEKRKPTFSFSGDGDE